MNVLAALFRKSPDVPDPVARAIHEASLRQQAAAARLQAALKTRTLETSH